MTASGVAKEKKRQQKKRPTAKEIKRELSLRLLSTPQKYKYSGTVLICVQNLQISGANGVLLNIIKSGFHPGNVIVLSPVKGHFVPAFQDLGVAVRVGTLSHLLENVTDIRLVICNTIMMAPNILLLAEKKIPHLWILHEWWTDDVLRSMFAKRKIKDCTEEIVLEAFKKCDHTVYVCDGQKQLYGALEPSSVIPVGTLEPSPKFEELRSKKKPSVKTFLVLGIICPRKNQLDAVKHFKAMAEDRQDLRLQLVGARHERDYEVEYLAEVKEAVGDDKRIEIHDATPDVEPFFSQADVLLMVSTNEVTPLVIPEAMMRSIPVITSNIAGIPSMLSHGIEGFVIPPDRHDLYVQHMRELIDNPELSAKMGKAGCLRAKLQYSLSVMVSSYRRVAYAISPPIVLLDMDGCVVDWDAGFRKAWGDRPLSRKHYAIEDCVEPSLKAEAKAIFHKEGFFRDLPPMPGAIDALKAMEAKGLNLQICTSPILTSVCCVQEKLEWVLHHLGESWLKRIVITADKTVVKGDVLIDDNPNIVGSKYPSWTQVMFDAPYNQPTELKKFSSEASSKKAEADIQELKSRQEEGTRKLLRLHNWSQWESILQFLIYLPKGRHHVSRDDTNWHSLT
jgi:5'-nucleotidase